jgi:biotin transporter BioY
MNLSTISFALVAKANEKRIVGSVMFCMLGSHLDIVHTICAVAKFLEHLQQIHHIVINVHIFKYLHGIIWLLIIMEVNIAQTLEEKLLFAIVCLFVANDIFKLWMRLFSLQKLIENDIYIFF